MQLQGKNVLQIVSDDFEDLELWYPVHRLREEGANVILAGEKADHAYIGKYGVPAKSDIAFDDVDISSYDAILVPGGWSPDLLRRFDSVKGFVRFMHDEKRPIGQICHAGWVLISAKILDGVSVTIKPNAATHSSSFGARLST